MKIALLFYEAPVDYAALSSAEQAAYMGAWYGYIGSLKQAGVMVGGEALQPAVTASRTTRVRNGVAHVQDGPFAETKEELGGFVILEVPGMDEALHWAAQCPGAANGSVEARIVQEMGDDYGGE